MSAARVLGGDEAGGPDEGSVAEVVPLRSELAARLDALTWVRTIASPSGETSGPSRVLDLRRATARRWELLRLRRAHDAG